MALKCDYFEKQDDVFVFRTAWCFPVSVIENFHYLGVEFIK